MQQIDLLGKHDSQIDELKSAVSELNLKMTVMLHESQHTSQRVEEIWEVLQEFKKIQLLMEGHKEEINILKSRIEKLESQMNISLPRRFFNWVKQWSVVITITVTILIYIGDWLYHSPPPHV